MEALSRSYYIETGKSVPKLYMTARQLAEYEGKTPGHYRAIINEIADQINLGRYSPVALGESEPRSVNYYVYRDYMAYRKRLKDRNMRKYVKPFNPAEIAAICPIVKEVIVMGEET